MWHSHARPAAIAKPLLRAFASGGGGGRAFYQRLNEQYLAHELENLAASAHGPSASTPKRFDPAIKVRPKGRLRAGPREASTMAGADDENGWSGSSPSFPKTNRQKPWLQYESMRGEVFGKKGTPAFQDLQHHEAQRLQEMQLRKRMLDRKLMFLKMQHLPNPKKDAKMEMRRLKTQEEDQGEDMYPLPFLDLPPASAGFKLMQERADRETLESRFRMRIRQQKLDSARVAKSPIPQVGEVVTDPLKRHIQRRLLRQRAKIKGGLEPLMSSMNSQMAHEFLKGAAISIVRVTATRPRQTQRVYYNLTSDHDPEWVRRQLNILAPKIRSQLALKENMGQTPAIRFLPQAETQERRRAHLWRSARIIQRQIPVGGGYGTGVGVG